MSKDARKRAERNQAHRDEMRFRNQIARETANHTNKALSQFYRGNLERKAEVEAYDRAYEANAAEQTPDDYGMIEVGLCHEAGVKAVEKVRAKAERDAQAKRAKRAGSKLQVELVVEDTATAKLAPLIEHPAPPQEIQEPTGDSAEG